MPFLENLMERVNLQEKRNTYASVSAGILFASGWWMIFDVAARYPAMEVFHHAYHVCGVVGTISMIMINMVSNGAIRGDSYSEDGCLGSRGARGWFFLGLVLGFTALIASCWILFQAYVIPANVPQWPGVGLFMQNLFIFLSSLMFRFGRSEELWSS
ncbi:transmembrane protein 50A-like [Daphnia pulicaria]|uniref:transmembrane protein 50A-like n=1 Tax=Daphnia pulicaria TaxID=35523 RepID=UPI001EEC1391|nr:transmembrane protein 50A-like [Daphnia pulicaria]